MHLSPPPFEAQNIGHVDGRLATVNYNFLQDLKFFTQPGGVIFALYQSPVVKGHRWQKEKCTIVFPASAAGFIPLPHFTLVVFPALQLSRRLLLRGKPKSQDQC